MGRIPRLPGRYYSVHDDTMQQLADAVRYRTGTVDDMTIGEMTEELDKQYFEKLDDNQFAGVSPVPWSRPSEWPDISALPIDTQSGDDTIWMLYDADQEASAIAWHIDTGSSSLRVTADIGHIENGSFVTDETIIVNNNTNFIKWLDEYQGYIVVRLTGHITHCYGVAATANGITQAFRQQPLLERVSYIPNMAYLAYNGTTGAWGMWTLESEIISNGDGSALTSLAYAWCECQCLRNLDISGLHTQSITNMSYAFSECMALRDLDLTHFDVSLVANFSYTFNGCYGLRILDLAGWQTNAATNMSYMFQNCRQIIEIPGLEDFDTSGVTTFAAMFSTCLRFKEADLSKWSVGAVTSTSSMFATCRGIQKIDLHGWKATALVNAASMFATCQSVKIIDLTDFETGSVTSVASMFSACYALQHIDISGIKVTSVCTNIYSMFANCWGLKELNFPEWDVSGIRSGNNTANSMFANCYSLETITGISNWQFNFTNSLGSMFSACRSLKELDVSGWKVNTITSFASMFINCWGLRELDLSEWNPENCTNLSSMFSDCHSLRTVGDISGWNTGKVTTLASMFNACMNLSEDPNISDWNVEKVTTTASMFANCSSLKELTIIGWNLAACTTIATMFRYMYNLEKITLTGWQLPKLTATAPAQFLGDCWNLREVYPPPIPLNHSYANSRSLTHACLVRIINSLPTVTTARTINLTASNVSRLTADEKAIATAKKWTIAN